MGGTSRRHSLDVYIRLHRRRNLCIKDTIPHAQSFVAVGPVPTRGKLTRRVPAKVMFDASGRATGLSSSTELATKVFALCPNSGLALRARDILRQAL